jgi:ABC-type Mn2+/Zn2+ transport system permease subunit
MMLLGAGFSVASAVVGLYISYYWNIASGAAMVLVATIWFGLVFIGKRARR